MDFDVIIVGAGPAGLNCAKNLPGKKVLVLEKNPEIGPKVCAGGLTPEDLEYLKLPKNLIERSFKKIIIHTTHDKNPIVDDYPVSTIGRKNLGQWQLKNLGKNVTVRTGTKVSEIGKDYVIVDGLKAGFRFLVGADGSSSLVRRHLNLPMEGLGIAFHYIIPWERKDLEIFFNAELFGAWYAWIFPYKGCMSVGCGCNPKVLSPSKLRRNFHRWLESSGIDYSTGKFESHPINFDYRGYRFGNIFLAGDAAGLASGLTGEGIYQALISGEEIAKLILNPKHKPVKLEKLISEKKRETAVLKRLNSIMKKRGPFPEIERILLEFFEED